MRQEQERLEAEERAVREAQERVLRRTQLLSTDQTIRGNQRKLADALKSEYENDRVRRLALLPSFFFLSINDLSMPFCLILLH